MQEQKTLDRLSEVEAFVKSRAKRYAFGDPMLAEDLAQEARGAVLNELKANPDCPDSHLMVQVKNGISKYRRRGKSVDGKLDPDNRTKNYETLSLQGWRNDEDEVLEETLVDHRNGPRPTEEWACTNVLYGAFSETLSAEEKEVLSYRLEDSTTTWSEISTITGKDERELYQIRRGLEASAVMVWELPEQYTVRPERTQINRTPPLPTEIPPPILNLLSEKARVALAVYRNGSTQSEAAKQAGLHAGSVSRIVAFVYEQCQKPPEEVGYKNQRQALLSLFHHRSAGEVVSYGELLALFPDVKDPFQSLWVAVAKCNRELEGSRIVLVKGEGYVLREEG